MINISTPTIEDATRFWIGRDFSMVSTSLVQKAFASDAMEELELLAGGPRKSDCCNADTETRDASQDEIESDDAGHSHYHVTNGKIPVCGDCGNPCSTHWEGAVYAWPAAHGMMFTPDDRADQDWIRDNAAEIADKCGFLIYESDETGIILGIDGGGYDFYDQHWIPLYKMRGFEWHDKPLASPKRASKPRKAPSKRKATRKPAGKATPAKRKASRKAS